jgi:hypothetical protein
MAVEADVAVPVEETVEGGDGEVGVPLGETGVPVNVGGAVVVVLLGIMEATLVDMCVGVRVAVLTAVLVGEGG